MTILTVLSFDDPFHLLYQLPRLQLLLPLDLLNPDPKSILHLLMVLLIKVFIFSFIRLVCVIERVEVLIEPEPLNLVLGLYVSNRNNAFAGIWRELRREGEVSLGLVGLEEFHRSKVTFLRVLELTVLVEKLLLGL
jgi:hypothetical protein